MSGLENWNRTAATDHARHAEPADVDALIAVVKDTAAFPSPVRAVGELHSTTRCVEAPRGTLLLMRSLRSIEVRGEHVVAGAGATMLEIRDALRPHGRELPVSPEIGNATAGSVACSGSKDSSLGFRSGRPGLAQIGSAVVEVRMVDAAGRVWRIDDRGATHEPRPGEAPSRPDPGLTVAAVRSSHGLLGIIVEVTFRTVPRRLLLNRYAWLRVPRAGGGSSDTAKLPDIEEIFDGADAVLGFLQPYEGRFLAERRTILPAGERATAADDLKRRVRDFIWEWGASEATTALTGLADILAGDRTEGAQALLGTLVENAAVQATDSPLDRLFRPGRLVERIAERLLADLAGEIQMATTGTGERHLSAALLAVFDRAPGPFFERVLQEFRACRSDSLVDFTRERATFFDFTFWAFGAFDWPRVVPAYLKFCADHTAAHGGYRPALFTEVYFICADASSLLSFAPREGVFTLDIVDNRPSDPAWAEMNQAYNRWAVEHGGRPLMNQTKELDRTPDVIRRAYGAAWTEFSRLVWAANPPLPGAPDGRFVSPYFRALLDPR